MNLLDLPVLPVDRDSAVVSNIIIETYAKERKEATTPEQLFAFIKKWKAIWLLQPGPAMSDAPPDSILGQAREPIRPEVFKLVNGEFDAEKVLAYLASDPEPVDTDEYKIACNLAVPCQGMLALTLATHFRVNIDIGFVRLYLDTYPEFDNIGRPFNHIEL
jgi:hypothetical protein